MLKYLLPQPKGRWKKPGSPSMLSFLMSILLALMPAINMGCAKRSVVITKGSVEERQGVRGSCVLGLNTESTIHKELCSSDLPAILKGSKLSPLEQRTLFGYICKGQGGPEEIRAFYQALSVEKRISLMQAFERRGYYFNAYG